MKPEAICITTRQPRNASDPGESETVHFVVENNVVRVVDADGHLLRFHDGEPVLRHLQPGDNPRAIAARLGFAYYKATYGDRERGFWRRDLGRGPGAPV
jgi:hypothetical protein